MNRISIDKDIRCGLWFNVEMPKAHFYEDEVEDMGAAANIMGMSVGEGVKRIDVMMFLKFKLDS